jgi:hypothetical protein
LDHRADSLLRHCRQVCINGFHILGLIGDFVERIDAAADNTFKRARERN